MVRKWRSRKGWSQEKLAQKLQLSGWTISRHSVAKLELKLRRVSDCELLFLAKTLGIPLNDLFPKGLELKRIGPAFQGNQRIAIFPGRADK